MTFEKCRRCGVPIGGMSYFYGARGPFCGGCFVAEERESNPRPRRESDLSWFGRLWRGLFGGAR